MKNLLWTTLLCSALAPMAAGCFVTVDDPNPTPPPTPTPPPPPPPTPAGPGVLDVTWTLTAGLDPVTIEGCSEGVTAEIVAEDTTTGEQYIDVYDCAALGGQTTERPAGEYDVWVNIYNGLDVLTDDLIAQSDYQTVIVQGDDIVPLDFFFPAGGFVFLTWSITDAFGPDATCEDVPADGVSVLSTLVGPDTAIDDIYNCSDFEATTPELLLGEYVVSVSLLNGDESLNLVSVTDPVSLEYGHQVVDLQNFVFDVVQ